MNEFLLDETCDDFLLLFCSFLIALPLLAQESTGVTAERRRPGQFTAERPDIESLRVNEIASGTRYPVLGRSEFFPWLLLGDPATTQPLGWVFNELVTVQGNLNTVPFSTLIVEPGRSANCRPHFAPATASAPTATQGLVGVFVPATPAPTATLDLSNVISPANSAARSNIRFGPGVEYDRVGVGVAGDQFQITAWHTQLPWLQVRYPDSPNGQAWIARDLLEVNGDLFSLPAISQIGVQFADAHADAAGAGIEQYPGRHAGTSQCRIYRPGQQLMGHRPQQRLRPGHQPFWGVVRHGLANRRSAVIRQRCRLQRHQHPEESVYSTGSMACSTARRTPPPPSTSPTP